MSVSISCGEKMPFADALLTLSVKNKDAGWARDCRQKTPFLLTLTGGGGGVQEKAGFADV